ncbi:MAG: hypothetical protein ABI813_01550 [Bacteroidota bacterium]
MFASLFPDLIYFEGDILANHGVLTEVTPGRVVEKTILCTLLSQLE